MGMGVGPSSPATKGLVLPRNTQKRCWDLGMHMQGWGLGAGVSQVSLARLGIPSRGKTPFQDPAALAVLGAESWQCREAGISQVGGVALPPSSSLPQHTGSAWPGWREESRACPCAQCPRGPLMVVLW